MVPKRKIILFYESLKIMEMMVKSILALNYIDKKIIQEQEQPQKKQKKKRHKEPILHFRKNKCKKIKFSKTITISFIKLR
jgi:hypothetical protein